MKIFGLKQYVVFFEFRYFSLKNEKKNTQKHCKTGAPIW